MGPSQGERDDMTEDLTWIQGYWDTATSEMSAVDDGTKSIVDSGPIILRAMTNLTIFVPLKDEIWTGMVEWCFANTAPHILNQGPEFHAWRGLTSGLVDLMPEELRDRPRG